MATENRRKRAGTAAEQRRAATYLGQLAWLEGFPDEGGWRRLDYDELIALDGGMISKARRSARTVMREYPQALPKLVGDVDMWWAITDAKLAWCSATLAGKSGTLDLVPLLGSRSARLARQLASGPVRSASRAAVIAWSTRPELLAYVLDWLARNAGRLASQDDRIVLALARLVAHGDAGRARAVRERGIDALIALLEVDATEPVAAINFVRNLENRVRGHRVGSAPAPNRSTPHVTSWILQLAVRETTVRQRVLAMLGEAQLAEAIAPWQAWEQRHATTVARAQELASVQFDGWEKAVRGMRVIQSLEHARTQTPVPLSIGDALLEVEMLGRETLGRFHPAIVRLLAAVPAALGPAARARMLLHVARTAGTADDDEHFEWLWDALADAAERGAPVELFSPWKPILTGEGRLYVESDLVTDARRRGDAQAVVRVLVELARRERVTLQDCARVPAWLAAGLTDESLLAEVVVRLRDTEGWLPVEVARCVLALAEPAAADLEAITKALLSTTEHWAFESDKRLFAFIDHAVRTGGRWVVRDAVLARQGERLSTIVNSLRLLPRSRWPALTHDRDATWIADYPAALAPALRRLASADPDAERTAAKRLASDLPDPAAIRREIAALRAPELRGKPGVAKRLANLEARLAAPGQPSAARLQHLATKLERAARDIALTRFTTAITTAAIDRIVRAFSLSEYPTWARESRTLSLLLALLELDEADRALAGRLVRARCGSPPWDLREDPANRAYLDEMRRANVDPAPWLDDTARVVTARDGEPLALALTSDPVEVFAMGAHFETCLAPDGGNFFSVIANAADINKRVLYARRGDRVVGRCLLALTDSFSLLAFHIYSHEPLDLERHVRDFAIDLAQRMNTTIVPAGSVRRLLARDWYDDGPRDLVGRFRGLDEAGLAFDSLDPAKLVDVLRAALGRDLDDVTLPIVLAHPGMVGRPELVFPLAPFVLASRVPLTRIAAAHLSLRAGDERLADRMLGDHASAIQIAHHVWPHGELLARLRPSYTLARLRETRRRHVRSWQDDDSDRIALAGVALEALHRPKQAARRYRLAMREEWLTPFMVARLTALGEPVRDEDASSAEARAQRS